MRSYSVKENHIGSAVSEIHRLLSYLRTELYFLNDFWVILGKFLGKIISHKKSNLFLKNYKMNDDNIMKGLKMFWKIGQA